MAKHRIYAMSFASVYPHYVAKAEKKGRTQAEVDQIITWLTGYGRKALAAQLEKRTDIETFVRNERRLEKVQRPGPSGLENHLEARLLRVGQLHLDLLDRQQRVTRRRQRDRARAEHELHPDAEDIAQQTHPRVLPVPGLGIRTSVPGAPGSSAGCIARLASAIHHHAAGAPR